MKFRFILGALIFLTSIQMMGQKLLVLEKAGTVKNFKYKIGDEISVELVRDKIIFTGPITEIKDSGLVIDYYNEVKIREISKIFRKSKFLRYFSRASITAGIFYFSLDAVNGVINNDSPVIAESTLIATGALLGTGFLMRQFVVRKYALNDKWRLKILDFSFPAD